MKKRSSYVFEVLIDLVPEDTGGLKYNHPSSAQSQVFSGLGVASPPSTFILYDELPKATDKDVFFALKRMFDDFKKPFHNSPRLTLAESYLVVNAVDDAFFAIYALLFPPKFFVTRLN